MPVHDVEPILKRVIEDTLVDILGEDDKTEVHYHLTFGVSLDYCPGDEDEDTPPHYNQRPVWRLNLFIEPGSESLPDTNFVGSLPYAMCSDGDPGPMEHLVRAMWEDYTFGSLLVEGNLSEQLEQVVTETEQG